MKESNISRNSIYAIGVLIVSTVLWLVLSGNYQMIFASYSSKTTFIFTRFLIWSVLLIALLYVKFIEKEPFLLWKDKAYSILFYITATVLLYLVTVISSGIINLLVQRLFHESESNLLNKMTSFFRDDVMLIIFTCATAAVVEELLIRGYIQPRIEKLYNSPSAGIIFSSVLFGLLHFSYGTASQITGPLVIGLIFAVFYKKYQNIKILMLCHFLIDFVALLSFQYFN